MTRILAAALALSVSFGATWPARACTRRTLCCNACERSAENSIRPDCCQLFGQQERAEANAARELPVPTPSIEPATTLLPVALSLGPSVPVAFVEATGERATSPPTPLRV